MVRRSRRASGSRRTRRRSKHSTRRHRHTKGKGKGKGMGRGRHIKRGGMLKAASAAYNFVTGNHPPGKALYTYSHVDNNEYLVDSESHTPFGVYVDATNNGGKYPVVYDNISFYRWAPRSEVKGSLAQEYPGDTLNFKREKGSTQRVGYAELLTLKEIMDHYSRMESADAETPLSHNSTPA